MLMELKILYTEIRLKTKLESLILIEMTTLHKK